MTRTTSVRDERGIAIVLALFMMLAMSVIGTSLMFVSQTETLSSHNYRITSQARYAAESGVHRAANYLLNTYVPPGTPGNSADPIGTYNLTVSPVTYNGQPVVLSWDTDDANYPVSAVRSAFASAAQGTLDVKDAPASYRTTARLMSMRQITDAYSNLPVTLQTWEISAEGRINGARTARIEVASTVERQSAPLYAYAAFATFNGCDALSFAGGAHTDSYDSGDLQLTGNPPVPTKSESFGNVGTNGNLTEVGSTTEIHGSLSTPRTGVGACTTANVTAQTISGGASVSEGLNQLPQPLAFPTPATPNPLPPTNQNLGFTQNGGCPAGLGSPSCVVSTGGATLDPQGGTLTLGDITTNGGSNLQLKGGTYVVNSLTMAGSSKITLVPNTGPVIIQVVGLTNNGSTMTTPLTITGNGVVNSTFDPSNLQIIYAGTGEVKLAGGEQTAALFYAPNASGSIVGSADLYGAIVVNRLTATGGSAVHYDRRLQGTKLTAGNYMMSAFTWRSY